MKPIISLSFIFTFLFFTNVILGQKKDITEPCGVCSNHDNSSVERSPTDGYKNLQSVPKVIDVAINESFFFEYTTFFDDVASIEFLGGNFFNLYQINGNPISVLSFLDDGQGNDAVAGDKIFTSESMVYTDTPFDYVLAPFMRFTDVRYTYSNGSPTETINIDIGAGIRMINGANIDLAPIVHQLNSQMQATSHVTNVVGGGDNPLDFFSGFNPSLYYDYFSDDQDFLALATTFPTPGEPAASFTGVSRDIQGITHPYNPFDNSAIYGSAGRLKGIVRYYYTHGGGHNLTNHELLHHWGTSLHPDLNLTIGGSHWTIMERPKSGFGSGLQCTDIVDLGNDCYDRDYNNYTGDFNDLEKYLMGLNPITDVSWPIKTLVGWPFGGNSSCPYFSTTGIDNVTQAEFLASMGPRVPDHLNSQHDFEMGMMVISDRFLTAKEMAYYQFQMEQNELSIGSPDRVAWSTSNFEEATDGDATLDTKLELCQGLISKDLIREIDAMGMLTITSSEIGSDLNNFCGYTNISIDPSSFDCTDINIPNPPSLEFLDTFESGSANITEIAVKDNLIYLSNFTLDKVDVFDEMGVLQFSFGDASNFSSLGGIAFASNGDIYAGDNPFFGSGSISVFDSGGTFLFDFDTEYGIENIFIYNNLLYVAFSDVFEPDVKSVGVYDLSGNFIEHLFTTPTDVFGLYIENDLIYTVGQNQNSTAYVHDLNGVMQLSIATGAWTSDISADTCGNIFIAAAADEMYQVYDENGVLIREEDTDIRSFYNQNPNLLYGVNLAGDVTKIEVTCGGEFFTGQETITFSADDLNGNPVSTTSTLIIEDPNNVCNCPDINRTISSNPIPSDFYEVKQTINSAGFVPVNGDVTFAGGTICLDNGFEVQVGATFEAIIDPCGL